MDYDKLGGGLVNLVLGALILWVGQTTFKHAGMLAGIDQKYNSVETHHETLRARLDSHISQLNEKTRSRFTREDGDKIRQQLEEETALIDDLERRMTERLTALQLKVIALETRRVEHTELAQVNYQLRQLQSQLRGGYHQGPSYPAQQPSVANSQPTYLPPPQTRR